MKKLSLLSAAAAAILLASCAKEPGRNQDTVDDANIAFVSITVDKSNATRVGSTENAGLPEEGKLNSLYVLTFNALGDLVPIPGNTAYHQVAAKGDNKTPDAFKISASSKNIVVVANPGPKLKDVIENLPVTANFGAFNAAISAVTVGEIADGTNGFTMITAGDEAKAVNDVVAYPFVEIGDKIQVVSDKLPLDKAKAAAESNRLKVKLERLTAKFAVKPAATIAINGDGLDKDKVQLTSWTLDNVNTTFFPFAKKILLSTTHSGADYTKNFYTVDPNYVADPIGYTKDGLARAYFDNDREPQPPHGDGWVLLTGPKPLYAIENTMDKDNQRFGSTTRVIMKAVYTPDGYAPNTDWFSWKGVNYKSLADLQTAYAAASPTSSLKDACDRFFQKVISAKSSITAADFAALSEADLADIKHGGQAVKEGTTPVIRWYQKGLCYYSYDVRHDTEITDKNALAKYGVVRNNWYDLTLNSVKGPGTPWYPESTNPGPGDPDPKDPIDDVDGYVGIQVTVNNWVLWTTPMDEVD